MEERTLQYEAATREPNLARSFGIFAPAAVTIVIYGGAILLHDSLSWDAKNVISVVIVILLAAAEVATAILAWCWWRRLHIRAKVGTLFVLVVGALFNTCVLGVNFSR